MHRISSANVLNASRIAFGVAAMFAGAVAAAPTPAIAQTTIFQNVNATNAAFIGYANDDNALWAFTTIGTGNNRLNNWRVDSLEIGLDDTGAARNIRIDLTFYSNINVGATGATVVNTVELFPGEIFNGASPLEPVVAGAQTITAASTGGLFYLPNAVNATTFAVQLEFMNAAGTALAPAIEPLVTYVPTVGSDPGSSVWENANGTNPDTYTGSQALTTEFSGDNYNLFLQLNATAVPAPSSAAVLLIGAVPAAAVIRRRRNGRE